MKSDPILKLDSISKFHQVSGLGKTEHPLVSLVDYGQVNYQTDAERISWVQDFYTIGLKRNIAGKFSYGQQQYDFDEGLMSFVSPGQLVHLTVDRSEPRPKGILLLVHPDFLWNNPLAANIKKYDFFGYSINEALFLSEKEETLITELLQGIQREYHSNIDRFSQNIIIAQIELLLNYCERFYQRQFLTRNKSSHQVLAKVESVLDDYFNTDSLIQTGLPTAQYVAQAVNLSPNYLGSLLKTLTGQSTQQHIQARNIEEAKQKLSTTDLSISEIAYALGFEHSQSFSKLFKNKTKQSPMEFRAKFN